MTSFTRRTKWILKRDIEICKDLCVNGIVVGFLTNKGEIDIERTKCITESARPLSVTFHRAFDMCRDPLKALDQLEVIGVDRILTSGQKNMAPEGVELLADLVKKAGDRNIIMPGAGLNPANIKGIYRRIKAKEYHSTLSKTIESSMLYRRKCVYMGGLPEIPEYSWNQTPSEMVRTFLDELE